MKESNKSIRAYQNELPHLRGKVAAVALLLAISIMMISAASFAWLVISKSPEVKGVSTTIAANGNLEIALVGPEGNDPDKSAVGDSNKDLIERNITWGNLINLSDPRYGLDHLVLRPATLNESNLKSSPLFGAVYTEDGRIEKLDSNFGFSSWTVDEYGGGYFEVSDKLGIRAISSTKLAESTGYPVEYAMMKNAAESANATAGNRYIALTKNSTYMQSVAYIIGVYMTANMNAKQGDANLTNPTVNKQDVMNLRDMFHEFVGVLEDESEALAVLANFQLFVLNQGDRTKYVPFTAESLLTASAASLSGIGVQITNLAQFKKDLDMMRKDGVKLDAICDMGTVKWVDSGLNAIANDLMNYGICTVGGKNVNSIGASAAMELNNKTKVKTVITNGVLKNFEQQSGFKMNVGPEYNGGKGLKVTATGKRYGITMDGTVYAYITTDATTPSNFAKDIKYAEDKNEGGVGVQQAKDTFGLAMDLWIRTNASGTCLTLQGNVLTQKEIVRAKGRDAEGNEVELYSVTYEAEDESTGEKVNVTLDVYRGTSEGKQVWIDANSHTQLTEQELGGKTPTEKMKEIETVIGYEGDNRVWDKNENLTVNSTTQGSGSCYVYYADTPEDQARSLKLLTAMRVAFVDDAGTLLGEAYMDTEHHYARNGKVTVPLVMDPSKSIELGTDYEGKTKFGIMYLEKNVATRVTALVYLDGTNLTNADVLSAADIQGQLNIQFGSSVSLYPIDDEKLSGEELKVSASVDKNVFDYDTATGPMTTKLTVKVEGDTPKKVEAFFLRVINATQGSREHTVVLNNDGNGSWSADYTFTTPGNYILRSVRLDGVEQVLEERPTVTVEGFTIKSLAWNAVGATGNYASVLTAGSAVSIDAIDVTFATNDEKKMPKTVIGKFLKEDGTAVNVNFTYSPTANKWTGKARFISSGEYTLKYLILDGNYTEIPEGMQKQISIKLGIKAQVFTNSPTSFLYEGDTMSEDKKNLHMQVKILDNNGEEIQGLTDVKLYYSMRGFSAAEMGMDANLQWNAVSEYYEGYFKSKVGMYDFSRVTVGKNIINIATTSPSFTVTSPIPPSFNQGTTQSFFYAPNGTEAQLSVQIDECLAATVRAKVIKNGVEQEELVEGKLSGDNWVFVIPKDSNGGQDGEWAIKEILISGVWGSDGTPYTDENPMVFDMAGQSKVSTKVISKVNVRFDDEENKTYENLQFLQEQTLPQFVMTVTDANGNALPNVSNITVKYNYKIDSLANGGYSINNVTEQMGDFTITLEKQANGTKFVQNGTTTVKYAGTYELESVAFTFKADSTPIPINLAGATLPKSATYTLKSKTPTVKITAVSPTGTFTADTGGSAGSGHKSVTVPAFTETEATVYFKCSTSSSCGGQNHNIGEGNKVTITFGDMGKANKAELIFGTNVHIYKSFVSSQSQDKTPGYEWTAGSNTAVVRYIGYSYNKSGNDARTPAGTLTASTLTITDASGQKYTITLPKPITINNPY